MSWVATFLQQVFCGLRGPSPSPHSSQGNALLRPSLRGGLCQLREPTDRPSTRAGRAGLRFSPLSPLRKGKQPSQPQPSARAGPPPHLASCLFLKTLQTESLQVAGAGFSKGVQSLTPQNRLLKTAPGLGGGHRFNWICGEFGTLDGRLQGLKEQQELSGPDGQDSGQGHQHTEEGSMPRHPKGAAAREGT